MLLLFVSSHSPLEAAYIYFHYCIHLKTWNAERGRKVMEHWLFFGLNMVMSWSFCSSVEVLQQSLLESGGIFLLRLKAVLMLR